jgi:signal transduction histidine kinase/ActR/RegA family two-component response regulator
MHEASSVSPLTMGPKFGLARSRTNGAQFLERLTWGLIRASTNQDIADFVVELVLRDTSAQSCWLMLSDDSDKPDSPGKDGTSLKLVGARSTSGVLPELDARFTSWVVASGTPLRFDELGKDEEPVNDPSLGSDVRSLMCLPLVASNRIIGVLNLASPSLEAFTEQDQKTLTKAADHIAAALDRARRVDHLRGVNETILTEQVAEYRKRLVHSEKMSSLGGLLAGIVHELNNPLTTILGFAQLLARTSSDNRNLSTIISESERCARIVKSVLRISRTGADQRETTDLNGLIREAVELASYQLRLHDVNLGLNLTSGTPKVTVNSSELTQVLLNLITNGVQAMSSTDGDDCRINVTTAITEKGVSVSVGDNGIGMDRDRIERIFDPFFTTKENGTGLGLSLSCEMVADNGGTISVESNPGEGTTFTIEFALVEDDGESVDEAADKKRVLVVDDEHNILDLVAAILPSEDFSVDCAGSGEEGISKLERNDYDLLISDLRMPGVGGRELVEWARANNKKAEVLLLTGDIVSTDMKDFITTSGVSCLRKPFKIDELLSVVEGVLAPDETLDDNDRLKS